MLSCKFSKGAAIDVSYVCVTALVTVTMHLHDAYTQLNHSTGNAIIFRYCMGFQHSCVDLLNYKAIHQHPHAPLVTPLLLILPKFEGVWCQV